MQLGSISGSREISSRFTVESVLGNGAFATVYLARCKQIYYSKREDHTKVALKVIDIADIVKKRRRKDHDYETRTEFDTERLLFSGVRSQDGEEHYLLVKAMLEREISVHKSVSKHPNIITMLDSFAFESMNGNETLAIVMEFCPLGDLHKYLKKKRDDCGITSGHASTESSLLSEEEVRHAMRQLFRGLSFLHSRGIAHRDIKAGNILLTPLKPFLKYPCLEVEDNITLINCNLKLGDFGLAVQMSDVDDWDDAQHTLCGTPSCLAPEVALSTPCKRFQIESKKGTAYSRTHCNHHTTTSIGAEEKESEKYITGHGQPADLWSTGCLLYAMLMGRYPFAPQKSQPCHKKDARVSETINRAIQGDWSIPSRLSLSSCVVHLLKQLLSLDPKQRGFARGLLSTHSFFNQNSKAKSSPSHSDIKTQSRRDRQISKTNEVENDYRSPYKRNFQPINLEPFSEPFESRHTRSRKIINQHRIKEKKNPSPSQSLTDDGAVAEFNILESNILVNPIENIRHLPQQKLQWNETLSNKEGGAVILHYSVYILSSGPGLVMHCKRNSGIGTWLHVTIDGALVSVGKMNSDMGIVPSDESFDLVWEAFACRPAAKRTARTRDMLHTNEYHSFCANVTNHRSISSSRSAYSVPNKVTGLDRRDKSLSLKPLSYLLLKKNRFFLYMYRKLENTADRLMQNKPRVILYIHSYQTNNSSKLKRSADLLCKANLMGNPNECTIDVTFLDGVRIAFNVSRKVSTLLSGTECFRCRIDDKLNLLPSRTEKEFLTIKRFSFYFRFARTVTLKCMHIEQCQRRQTVVMSNAKKRFHDVKSSNSTHRISEEFSQYTVVNRYAAVGKCHTDWVDITNETH